MRPAASGHPLGLGRALQYIDGLMSRSLWPCLVCCWIPSSCIRGVRCKSGGTGMYSNERGCDEVGALSGAHMDAMHQLQVQGTVVIVAAVPRRLFGLQRLQAILLIQRHHLCSGHRLNSIRLAVHRQRATARGPASCISGVIKLATLGTCPDAPAGTSGGGSALYGTGAEELLFSSASSASEQGGVAGRASRWRR